MTAKPDIVAAHATDPREESARCTRGFGRRQPGCRCGKRGGPEQRKKASSSRSASRAARICSRTTSSSASRTIRGFVTSPKNAPLFGLRLGLRPAPDVRHRSRGRRDPDQGARATTRAPSSSVRAVRSSTTSCPAKSPAEVRPLRARGRGHAERRVGERHAATAASRRTPTSNSTAASARSTTSPTSSTCGSTRARSASRTRHPRASRPTGSSWLGVGFTFGGHRAAAAASAAAAGQGQRQRRHPRRRGQVPDAAGPRENDGCPDKDTDGDGVVDRKDKCPDKAGPPEREGCPEEDKDNDGIPDDKDKCPDEAEDKDGFEDEDGCPDPGQRQGRRPRRERQVPERARDQERLSGRGRLPRRGPGAGQEVHRRHQGHQLPAQLGRHQGVVVPAAEGGGQGVQGVPGAAGRDLRATPRTRASATST